MKELNEFKEKFQDDYCAMRRLLILENELEQLEAGERIWGVKLSTLLSAFNGIKYKKDGEMKTTVHIALIDYAIYNLEDLVRVNGDFTECDHVYVREYGKTWALIDEELQ